MSRHPSSGSDLLPSRRAPRALIFFNFNNLPFRLFLLLLAHLSAPSLTAAATDSSFHDASSLARPPSSSSSAAAGASGTTAFVVSRAHRNHRERRRRFGIGVEVDDVHRPPRHSAFLSPSTYGEDPSSSSWRLLAAAFSSSTTTASNKQSATSEKKIGRFQSGYYDKPIVLIGCSGDGGELHRLASSLLTGASKEEEEGKVIDGCGLDDDSPYVLDADVICELDSNSVVVLDFNHPAFHIDDGAYAGELTTEMSSLARQLHDKLGLLGVYVNVAPVDGRMSGETSSRKTQLERDVFIKYSFYELTIKHEGLLPVKPSADDDWIDVEWELHRIVGRAMLNPPMPGSDFNESNSAMRTLGTNTACLELPGAVSNIEEDVTPERAERICRDVDAIEVRADLLLEDRKDRFALINSIRRLRAKCRRYAVRAPALPFRGRVLDDALPIALAVRTKKQGGTWPDDDEEGMFETLELGLRSAVEILDVESASDSTMIDALLTRHDERGYATHILGSHRVVDDEVSDVDEAVRWFRRCTLDGRAHGVKVTLAIKDESHDGMANDAAEEAIRLARDLSGEPIVPHIGIASDEVGQYSRVLNDRFTPVSHECLPTDANDDAGGSLTATEVTATRMIMGLLLPQKYGILGHNIAYSVSPQMQGAAFAATNLPHQYHRIDVESVDKFVAGQFWNDDDFGGCSVTIPHKQSIMPHLDVLSDAARDIGSVNTVIVEQVEEEESTSASRRVLRGDNTDWIGIYKPLSRKLGGRALPVLDDAEGDARGGGDGGGEEKQLSSQRRRGVALILGGGGTARAAAYAASSLGLDRLYYNRTPSKAAELAEAFGGTVLSSLGSGQEEKDFGNVLKEMNGEVRVVISTLPGAAEFVLPEWVLAGSSKQRPVVFDVNYKPYNTKLLVQAEEAGCDVVRGSEMLWEQGVGQFELWTGRTAPYKVMKEVVLENCLPRKDDGAE